MSSKPRQLLAVAGSLRRDSINLALLRAAALLAPPGLTISVFEELASLPLFNEDIEAEGLPLGVRRLREAVAAADGLLIATPEYNNSVPGVLKNAIDWLSRSAPIGVLTGKPVAVIGASTGSWGTRLAQAALRQILFATEALVLPQPGLFVRNANSHFDEGGRLSDETTRGSLRKLLLSFGVWIDVVYAQPAATSVNQELSDQPAGGDSPGALVRR
jgi:chromate reductase, NAD(P)H dehydrogenase (quinone)